MNKILQKILGVLIFFSLFAWPVVKASAYEPQDRDQIIAKKLNCAAQQAKAGDNPEWLDICSTEVPAQDNEERQRIINHDLRVAAAKAENANDQRETTDDTSDGSSTDDQNTASAAEDNDPRQNSPLVNGATQKESRSFKEFKKSRHKFEIGTEVYNYRYTESIGVKNTATKFGLIGSYQYRFAENPYVDVAEKFTNDFNIFNIFRLEGRFSYGEVKYEGSGTWSQIPDWNFETRGLAGMEVPFSNGLTLVPYAGLGYRYLLNESSVMPARSVNGVPFLSGYDRESMYIYIPLGVEANKEIAKGWSLTTKTEFDWFIWGHQLSHFENMMDSSGNNAGYEAVGNKQTKGMGWRASIRLTKETEHFNFFFEPYIRFWHIQDSIVTAVYQNGTLVEGAYEPDNKTTEYGLNIGVNF